MNLFKAPPMRFLFVGLFESRRTGIVDSVPTIGPGCGTDKVNTVCYKHKILILQYLTLIPATLATAPKAPADGDNRRHGNVFYDCFRS
jgi:hypothetical protein